VQALVGRGVADIHAVAYDVQSSTPRDDTASTTRVTPRCRHTRPTAPTGFTTPTEVSWWIMATTAMVGSVASVASTAAGSGRLPTGKRAEHARVVKLRDLGKALAKKRHFR